MRNSQDVTHRAAVPFFAQSASFASLAYRSHASVDIVNPGGTFKPRLDIAARPCATRRDATVRQTEREGVECVHAYAWSEKKNKRTQQVEED